MKDRIRQIMENENMNPARFADSLNIGRAVISHILNGRNNPSLEVITRILTEMPHISADWLISGKGSMYKDEIPKYSIEEKTDLQNFPGDLFSQSYTEPDNEPEKNEYENLEELKPEQNTANNIVNERIIYKERPSKKISKIIIYYSDSTYETFESEN